MKKLAIVLLIGVRILSTSCKNTVQNNIEDRIYLDDDFSKNIIFNSDEFKKAMYCTGTILDHFDYKIYSIVEERHYSHEKDINTVQYINPPKEEVKEITLSSVGDIMMHKEQIDSGNLGNGRYDYSAMFKSIKPYIEKSDFSVGNLEVTLSGKEKVYTGYPAFNAPEVLAQNLKDTGFDLVTTANNHSLDRKFYGVVKTIENLDKVGLLHTGSYKTSEDSEKILIQDIKGIKIAFLAYTYGTNGITVPEKFAVNLINKDKILNDIKKAKEANVDMVVASMHFGEEYKINQNKYQQDLVNFLFASGVDIVLGSHPHVLQPIEIKKITFEGKEKEVFVIYSQGNIVANMPQRYKNSGIIVNFKIKKDSTGTKLSKVDYIPTWVDASHNNTIGKKNFEILPLFSDKDYLNHKQYSTIKQSFNDSLNILNTDDTEINVFNTQK